MENKQALIAALRFARTAVRETPSLAYTAEFAEMIRTMAKIDIGFSLPEVPEMPSREETHAYVETARKEIERERAVLRLEMQLWERRKTALRTLCVNVRALQELPPVDDIMKGLS